jgi:hypothetical protein
VSSIAGGARLVSRKSDSDKRQQDFFGAPEAEPKAPAGKSPKAHHANDAERLQARTAPPALGEDEPDERSISRQIDRLSRVELRELVAVLADDTIAELTLITIRQLRRRLARQTRHAGKGRKSSLERAAQQLIAELGEQGGDDDF